MTPLRRRVLWSVTARNDLGAIIDWIAAENPSAARTALSRLRAAAERLHAFPDQGRVVPELRRHGIELYRELIVAPWRIIYRADDQTAQVLAVFDSRRDLEDLLLERLTRPLSTQ
ncbi:MAG: type II toxin-antitoxin system RelE/ParE family toxin [Desulfuromonadales bacterium]|nr:type II toxin-antitoxin system RelE/ParE family toxin [Desulfuromonadales bacterium]